MKNNLNRSYKYHGRFLGWGSGPDADWRVMFALFVIVVMAVVVLAIYLFISTNKELSLNESRVASPLNLDVLHRTAVYYQKQKVNFESARTATEITPDPSI